MWRIPGKIAAGTDDYWDTNPMGTHHFLRFRAPEGGDGCDSHFCTDWRLCAKVLPGLRVFFSGEVPKWKSGGVWWGLIFCTSIICKLQKWFIWLKVSVYLGFSQFPWGLEDRQFRPHMAASQSWRNWDPHIPGVCLLEGYVWSTLFKIATRQTPSVIRWLTLW